VTDDHHVPESLRAAADPGLSPGAASRIADGAWARAASLPRPGGVRFLAGPRVAWAAAAAVLVAVTFLALRGTEPAFAVEGDPVMVARGDELVPTRMVTLDSVVVVPEDGTRVLRWCDGGVLSPRRGSRLRFVRVDGAPREVRIEFERGGGEFDGASFVVATRDVVVEREPSAHELRFSIALTADDGEARVDVAAGQALVRSLASRERLLLSASESAAAMRVGAEGRKVLRLARLSGWTPDAGSQIASGRMSVVDAGFGPVGGITLFATTGAREMLALEVPLSQAREALARVNFVAKVRVACPLALTEAAFDARYTHEQGGRRVEVTKLRDGTFIALDGACLRSFPDVAAFRRDAPETAGLFGDALDH
jgi:hypothetical protein